jgi:predicted molibdopterin-dependent oxidoreductase YjgC
MEGYIEKHPIMEFSRKKIVRFYFEDQELEGYEGLPIAAALHAAGIKVLRYSEKYKRPRGFFCAVGKCSSCLMEVDGRPNVMVCMEPLREGMHIRRQKGKGLLK